MQRILSMAKVWQITERQLIAAARYRAHPARYRLAPSLHGILHELITKDRPVEELEAERGWPARSAKLVLRIILDALVEMEGTQAPDDMLDEMAAAFATPLDLWSAMSEFQLSATEARLFCLLKSRMGNILYKDAILNALYAAKPDDVPSDDLLKVLVSKIRSKLKGSRYRIETQWGVGYSLHESAIWDETDLRYYAAHTIGGESIKSIARREGVNPSTVSRRIARLLDRLDDSAEQALDEAAEACWQAGLPHLEAAANTS